ncbi:hypothetical protein GMA11_07140 [Granulicatella sp. zg-ZJ]|uniref:hypothetical protein n=1 Tax=Granulicatella sp. zg-ZJ TaxID=2678504 RepID=UPI0013D00C5F|nr:hypothetical protein [Granulicatella sp. zg-ZJ]NEW62307.1 hypothetical protein [Granulicatella sp. zg-ZJ]NEW63167.1 hypothetical protein [Granulicatella sp. zg-ZJ]
MKHKLKVSVSKQPTQESVMQCRKVSMREKVMIFLFGKKQNMLIFIPSDRVGEVTIDQKGENNG